MTTAEAISFFKTARQLASECIADGWPVSPAAISQWGKYPPQGRQRQIEKISRGALKAEQPQQRESA